MSELTNISKEVAGRVITPDLLEDDLDETEIEERIKETFQNVANYNVEKSVVQERLEGINPN